MGVGNVLLVLTAIEIYQKRSGFELSSLDLMYLATIVGLLAIRCVDIRFFHGKTIDKQPATMSHWLRYAGEVLGMSTALWLVMHFVSVT
jgi:hypothetical protein